MSTIELDIKQHSRTRGTDPLIGRQLLHYRVVEEIGQGGMSVVYRGMDEVLGRPVAIKVLHPFLAQKKDCKRTPGSRSTFGSAASTFQYFKIYDYSGETQMTATGDQEAPSEVFWFQEFVEGVTLRNLLSDIT